MAYVLTEVNRNEITFESKKTSRWSFSSVFISITFCLLLFVIFLLIPIEWKSYFRLAFVLILLGVVSTLFQRRKRNGEFQKIVFSATKGCLEFHQKGRFSEVTLAFNEIKGFEVVQQEKSRVTSRTKTRITYVYVVRMNLTNGGYWLLTTHTDEKEAKQTVAELSSMLERNTRKDIVSKGFVPKKIMHTRLGNKRHEFHWSNRNLLQFIAYIVLSLSIAAFFSMAIWLIFKDANEWLRIVVGIVFSIVFLLILGFVQLMQFPKQLQSFRYSFELTADRKTIQFYGIRKNGGKKLIFEKITNGDEFFSLLHFSALFASSNEKELRYMSPRKRLKSSDASENLRQELNELKDAKSLPLDKLSLFEVMAFRNYLNEMVRGLRD